MRTFLTAEWRKLAMANYVVEPEILTRYLPAGTELDIYDGKCFVSLVAFYFQDTRVMGFAVPFHRDFEEVNLRFYVRYRDNGEYKRGVVFIKEIVPKHAVTLIANTLYGENYQTMPMTHSWVKSEHELNVRYSWRKNGWNSFQVTADARAHSIVNGSEAEFITQHYWGYTRLRKNETSEYEVVHPSWEIYPVKAYEIKVNFENVYGPDFHFLQQQIPGSVFLAEGSPIEVRAGKKIVF